MPIVANCTGGVVRRWATMTMTMSSATVGGDNDGGCGTTATATMAAAVFCYTRRKTGVNNEFDDSALDSLNSVGFIN